MSYQTLSPEEKARVDADLCAILEALENETPAQADQRERNYADLYYTCDAHTFNTLMGRKGDDWEDAMAMRVKYGTITVEEVNAWMGAHRCGYDAPKEFADKHCLTGFSGLTSKLTKEQVKTLNWALRENNPCEWMKLHTSKISKWRCQECGSLLQFETNGVTIRLSPEMPPCAYPEGFKSFTTELHVPSGYLVLDDYFEELEVPKTRDDYDNSKQAHRHYSEDFNALHQGMAIAGYCGNVGLSLVGSKSKEIFILGRGACLPGTYTTGPLPGRYGTKIGGMLTDSREYALVDRDYLYSKEGCSGLTGQKLFPVKPGVYQAIYHGHYIDRDNYDEPQIFLELVWLRES